MDMSEVCDSCNAELEPSQIGLCGSCQEDTVESPDFAANLALHLVKTTGSVLGKWSGKLSAKEQRSLFGRFIGKGNIVIDGAAETICNRVKVCFGLDWDDRNVTAWRHL